MGSSGAQSGTAFVQEEGGEEGEEEEHHHQQQQAVVAAELPLHPPHSPGLPRHGAPRLRRLHHCAPLPDT